MSEEYLAGTHIRYGGNGICLIERVEDVPYPGPQPTKRCYVLRPVRNPGMAVSVPVDNALLTGRMQPLRTAEEIDSMLETAAHQEELVWEPERKVRSALFRSMLSAGDAPTLLRMIRCILTQERALSARGKHLSPMDESACRDAERMLDEEFAFTLGLTPDAAGKYIREKLSGAS